MKLIDEALSFWRNQSVNFKLMLFRNAILTLFNNLTSQYTSIYIRKLGATPQDISYLESAASFVTMILAIPAGLVIDRVKSIRKLYIMGGLISLPISLLKGLATSFQMFFTTRMWESITTRFYWPTIEIIQISSITNRDRVKGLVTSNMFISTLGLIAPLIAAYIITSLGGLENVDSYRPLFYIQFIASFFIYIIIVILAVTAISPVLATVSADLLSTVVTYVALGLIILLIYDIGRILYRVVEQKAESLADRLAKTNEIDSKSE